MEFTVKYRKSDGALDYMVVEAESRTAAFQALRERGISAIGIEEGASRKASVRAAASAKGRPALVRGIVAGAVVVVLAVAVYFFLAPAKTEGDAPSVKKPARKPPPAPRAEAQPPRPARPAPPAKPSVPAKPAEPAKPVLPILGKTPTGEDYVAMTAVTNADGAVTERYQLPDGSWKRVVQLQRKETMVFDNDFDLALSLIATTPMDQELPPLPDMGADLEAAFKKAIEHPIVISENDSERVKEMKRGAKAVRLEIADLLAEGYSIKQILNDHNGLRQQNIVARREFQNELNRIYRSGDINGAQEYLDTMNKALNEKGILPLTMPGSSPSAKKRKAKE